jgi:hypothetical protein
MPERQLGGLMCIKQLRLFP